MSASLAGAAFFPAPSSPSPAARSAGKGDHCPESLDMRGIAAKPGASSSAMQAKTRVSAIPKAKVAMKADVEESVGPVASASRTFYNQLHDWSMLLVAIMTAFLASDKQFALLDWKPKKPDMLADSFAFGRIWENGLIFSQNFSIRSYEIGVDKKVSIETLFNHLQDTALNHVKSAGLLGDGFGSTPEMSKRNLFWVVCQMQVLVERYPSWGDIVEVDTWVRASGKNGMCRDWHFRDKNTGQTILKAKSLFAMMHKHTRKLARIPDEVRAEIEPYFYEYAAIGDEDSRKLPKLEGAGSDGAAKHIRTGLTPRWGDLDINQHVNNCKYIGWILESAPVSILENHELASIIVDYKRECGRDSILQSQTTVHTDCTDGSKEATVQCEHLLQLESGATILKARTRWRPKQVQGQQMPQTLSAVVA